MHMGEIKGDVFFKGNVDGNLPFLIIYSIPNDIQASHLCTDQTRTVTKTQLILILHSKLILFNKQYKD